MASATRSSSPRLRSRPPWSTSSSTPARCRWPPDDVVWVDDTRHEAGDLVRTVSLLEGSRIGRSPVGACQADQRLGRVALRRMDAGRTVAVPARTGRCSSAARRTRTSRSTRRARRGTTPVSSTTATGSGCATAAPPTAPWSTGSRSSEDGTLVDEQAVVVVGGASITLWRGRDRGARTGPRHHAQPDPFRDGPVQPTATRRARPGRRSRSNRRPASPRRRRPGSAWRRSSRRW